jgi:hypothetical protein
MINPIKQPIFNFYHKMKFRVKKELLSEVSMKILTDLFVIKELEGSIYLRIGGILHRRRYK